MKKDKKKYILIYVSIIQKLNPNRADKTIFDCFNSIVISNRAVFTVFTKGKE